MSYVAVEERHDFNQRELHKLRALFNRLHWLEHRRDDGTSNDHLEQEAAALLWLLAEVDAICGKHILTRVCAANDVCVRPVGHDGDCDGRLS